MILTLMFVARPTAFSQTDSLYDVFPLSIGNRWTYQYSNGSRTYGYGQYCSGTAWFVIVGSMQTPDSTRWHLSEIRDLSCQYCSPYPACHTSSVRDTLAFELVELHTGPHQLYIAGATNQDVFPFYRSPSDSVFMVYRYRPESSWVNSCPTDLLCQYKNSCQIRFQAGQGELSYRFYCLRNGGSDAADHLLLGLVINSVGSTADLSAPKQFALDQNYPNPFNSTTRIRFTIPVRGFTTLKVYDVLGRKVATLLEEQLIPGSYEATFDGTDLANGVYFYRLHSGQFVETKKLLLLK